MWKCGNERTWVTKRVFQKRFTSYAPLRNNVDGSKLYATPRSYCSIISVSLYHFLWLYTQQVDLRIVLAELIFRKMTGLRFFAATVLSSCVAAQDMPLPWTRPLQIGDTGASVYIAQNLLDRAATVPRTKLNASGTFDDLTAQFVIGLQRIMSLNESGILDPPTAAKLLECCAQDHYKDEDVPPSSLGYAYKIHVKLHPNRSIEVPARLIAGNGTVLFEFTVRAHGVDGPANASVWPYFSSCCDGLNQFSGGGNTPTGLSECDLNTPEGNATLYGPYPVNRMVRGLKGNAKWLMTGERRGQLHM